MGVDYAAIGRRIKHKRKQSGKTQDRLAEALGVTVGYISQMERGVTKINLDTLARIAESLDCDLAELISGVTLLDDNYLYAELEKVCKGLDARQRRLLLEIANTLAKY